MNAQPIERNCNVECDCSKWSSKIPPKRWRQRYRQYQVYVEKALWQCARCEDPVRVARQFLVLAVGSMDPGTAAHIDETRITAAVALMCLAYE